MNTKIVDRPAQTEPDSVFGSQIIFDRTAEGVARVWVIDHATGPKHLRYAVSKIMRLSNGKSKHTTTWYSQRPAAVAYAQKFIEERISKLQAVVA